MFNLKHLLNVIISDVPHLVAAMVNKRHVNSFDPNAGRVDVPSVENIKKVEDGTYPQKS